VDQIYFYFGAQYRFNPVRFLNNPSDASISHNPMPGVEGNRQRRNIALLGEANRKIDILPIFYNLHIDYSGSYPACPQENQGKACDPSTNTYDGCGVDNLGKWLKNFPPNLASGNNPNNSYRRAEKLWLDQCEILYSNNGANIPSTGPNIPAIQLKNLNKLNVSGMAWFQYKCDYQGNYLADKSNLPCRPTLTSSINLNNNITTEITDELDVYPTVFNGLERTTLRIKTYLNVESVFIYNASGTIVRKIDVFNRGPHFIFQVKIDAGLYTIRVVADNKIINRKLLVK
jgi:hypothetical protein